MTDKLPEHPDTSISTLAVAGLLVVATAQVSNMILARGVAGTIPPFALAFFRWTLIALALSPLAIKEIWAGRLALAAEFWSILATGFLGMFLCGGPVYAAGETTGAINIALIMSLSPITVVLIAWLRGLERINPMQLFGMALALAGALLIIARGDVEALAKLQLARGDLFVLFAMLGWSSYTLLQVRVAPAASFLSRICVSPQRARSPRCRLPRGRHGANPRPCSARTRLPRICSPASPRGSSPMPALPG